MSNLEIAYMPQRESECRRVGKGEEERVARALQYWTNPLTDMAFCFECGREFQLLDPTSYPQNCRNQNCRKIYSGKGMFCLPDIILHEGQTKAVVFVNGDPHRKNDNQRYRDKYQIVRFKQFGYAVFIIWNEEIGRQSNLLSMTKTWVDMLKDPKLFMKIMSTENEWTWGI